MTARKTTTTTPTITIHRGDIDKKTLIIKADKDYGLSADMTLMDVAEVTVPKGHVLLVFPISSGKAIVTANCGRLTEGKHKLTFNAYAIKRFVTTIYKGDTIAEAILVKGGF